MNTKRFFVYAVVFLFAIVVPIDAAPSKRKSRRVIHRQTKPSEHNELKELLRRTQQAVEQAQAETRRAREQNEELLNRMEENTRELVRLRQEISGYGALIADLKTDRNEIKRSAQTSPSPDTRQAQDGGGLATQTPAQTALGNQKNDSPSEIEDRFERLQEQVDINAERIKEHAQTKVESDSRFRVKLFGLILANTYFNTDDSSTNDVPLIAPPPGSVSRKNNFGATLRQSRIGLKMEGPRLSQRLGEPRLSAEAEFDFWGGTNGRIDGDVLGSLRIITASARLDWENTSLIVGQRPPLVSALNPTSIAAVWFPPLTGAGNLWQWRPQIILEHRAGVGDSSQLILQGGVMTPFGESLQGATIEGGPGYESRVAYRQNLDSDQTLEIGFGGYFHRRPFPFDRRVNSYAITGDWTAPLGSRLQLSGEAYFGRAVGLGERSGGRNDRIYAVTGPIDQAATAISGVHSVGGWAQLAIKSRSDFHLNLAYGQDDPRNRDILGGLTTPATRFKNQVASTNFIWELRHNFLFSLEYRRLWTNYAARRQTGNHYNLAVGYAF
jgi:hypothetical protein